MSEAILTSNALFMAKRPAEAIAILERNAPTDWEHRVWLAACRAAGGNLSMAREVGLQVIALRPHFTINGYAVMRFRWKRAEDTVACALCSSLPDFRNDQRASRDANR
jgi:hypothetical protein